MEGILEYGETGMQPMTSANGVLDHDEAFPKEGKSESQELKRRSAGGLCCLMGYVLMALLIDRFVMGYECHSKMRGVIQIALFSTMLLWEVDINVAGESITSIVFDIPTAK